MDCVEGAGLNGGDKEGGRISGEGDLLFIFALPMAHPRGRPMPFLLAPCSKKRCVAIENAFDATETGWIGHTFPSFSLPLLLSSSSLLSSASVSFSSTFSSPYPFPRDRRYWKRERKPIKTIKYIKKFAELPC